MFLLKEHLLEDKLYNTLAYNLQLEDVKKNPIGKLKNFLTVAEITDILTGEDLEIVKHLPKSGYSILKTNSLGYGYISRMSVQDLSKLYFLKKLDENTPIDFELLFGNIFSYITIKRSQLEAIATDEFYIIYDTRNNAVVDMYFGKPHKPNTMYYRQDLHEVVGTLSSLGRIVGFNAVNFRLGK